MDVKELRDKMRSRLMEEGSADELAEAQRALEYAFENRKGIKRVQDEIAQLDL